MMDRTDGSGTAIFFLLSLLSNSLLVYSSFGVHLGPYIFFLHFFALLVTTTFVRVSVGLSVSVKVGMPTYLNPFLESWVISTCSAEGNLFFLPFFVSFHLLPWSLTGWVLQSNYFD